jgi:hypothetical protein
MVRGCQKKIVYLKNTGSNMFDEAYFVVRDCALGNNDECDMIKEANRILDECVAFEEKKSLPKTLVEKLKRNIIPFFIGITLGVVITVLIK